MLRRPLLRRPAVGSGLSKIEAKFGPKIKTWTESRPATGTGTGPETHRTGSPTAGDAFGVAPE